MAESDGGGVSDCSKQSKQLRYPPDIQLQHEHARFHIDFHKVSETQSPLAGSADTSQLSRDR